MSTLRSTMATLILRVRLLMNDPVTPNLVFQDSDIQDVLDESRSDVRNGAMIPKPTFTGATISYLDYYTELGNWEDDYVLKQYLVSTVIPSSVEPIVGHFQFSATTLPPIYITGKNYDLYRAAADLLERRAAQWMMSYSMTVDGQNLQRSQVLTMMLTLAKSFRLKQRAHGITVMRSDITSPDQIAAAGLGPTPIDYMSSGDGR